MALKEKDAIIQNPIRGTLWDDLLPLREWRRTWSTHDEMCNCAACLVYFFVNIGLILQSAGILVFITLFVIIISGAIFIGTVNYFCAEKA